MKENESDAGQFNRRDFIRSASTIGAMMAMMGGIPLRAEDQPAASDATNYSTICPPVSCGVIGCGAWGREIIGTLGRLPNAPIAAICDSYEPMVKRSKENAPKAETCTDYRKVLENKEVEAVIVATPTHLHREIVEAALQAGKHVYCEAPLACTIDDARAIAKAAKAATKSNFQAGLQLRANPQNQFVLSFIRSGATGKILMAHSQWLKKQSWRKSAPSPEREQALNWRLQKQSSTGVMGELGIHQLDFMNWMMHQRPAWASGYGSVLAYQDGRDVPDTVQAVLGYQGGVNYTIDCSIGTSYDADYDVVYGTDGSVMFRQNLSTNGWVAGADLASKAWLFKEVDAGDLGWEIYARKDKFYNETGIALVANASKSASKKASGDDKLTDETSMHFAMAAFIRNSDIVRSGLRDFVKSYGADAEGWDEYVAGLAKGRLRAAGYQEGFEATVTAIKANEAVLKGQKIPLEKELFEV